MQPSYGKTYGTFGGNKLNGLNGHANISSNFSVTDKTSVSPAFSRTGSLGLSTKSGINTYGAQVNHNFTNNLSGYAGGYKSSNGHSGANIGMSYKF